MIARTWHGRVPASKADAYHAYLCRTGLADFRATSGNRGVLVQRRVDGDVAHFTLTSFWDSIEAIKRFAGDTFELARYYPDDDDYLLEREQFVTHADVLVLARSDASDSEPEATRQPLRVTLSRLLNASCQRDLGPRNKP